MPLPKIIQFPLGLTENLQYHFVKVSIGSGAILTANTIPITLVTAPGAGKVLMPIFAVGAYVFDTAPYDTNVDDLGIIHQGQAVSLLGIGGLINSAVDITTQILPQQSVAITAGTNKALQLKELVGNPATGSGTLTIYLWYINLEL